MVRTPGQLLLIVLLCVPVAGLSQDSAKVQEDAFRLLYAPRDRTIELTVGITFPMSHAALTSFWLRGPSMGACFLFKANDVIRFGVGAEVDYFSFRRGTFQETFPGVPLQVQHLATVHVYLAVRNYLRPSLRMTPFFGAEIGVLRVTGAEYKIISGGVRHTYYEIPGMSHLAGGVSAGLDYYVNRQVAVQLQGRAVYVFNDPDTGILVTAHAGVKFAF
jgi:hypothetical protein